MIALKRTIHCCVARCSSKYSRQKKRRTLEELLMVMPKDSKLTAELQKHRHKLKEKTMKYSAGSVTLQVLGSGAKGAPRALYVFTDQSRYLFNCGEGTQRLAHEHKMKLSKLEHIFITHPSWRNIGGLPGVSLTIQDVGVPEITIHGPQGTADIYMATRRFVVLKDLVVKFRTDASGQFKDSVMDVDYIPISPVGEEHVSQRSIPENVYIVRSDDEDDNEDYYSYESRKASDSNSQSKRKKTSETNERKKLKRDGSLHRLGEVGACSMCYICRLHPKQGALQLDKCVEKGVPPGPLLGQLKAGRDVSLPNGVVVKASDVCSPPDPGPIFLVIECPSVDYIDSLVTNEKICKYNDLSNLEERGNLMAIAHFSPPDVISNPKYLEWVSNLPSSVTHLSFGEESNCTGSVAVHRLQYKLNLLHPKIFPLLADCGIPNVPNNKSSATNDSNSNIMQPIKDATTESPDASQHVRDQYLHNIFIKARTFYNIHLRPRKGFDSSTSLQMDHQEFIDETLGVDGFLESMKDLKEKLECITPTEQSYPKVLFLGTGSCIPNKTRNTSGILIEISEQSCMLLDCGEGTYGQLVRFFGQDESNVILSRLNCVFVSHLHADHHIGLISLLKERQKILKESKTLYLLAPRQIMFWLSFYHDGFESILNGVKLIPCAEVVSKHVDPNAAEHPVTSSAMRSLLGLQEVATAPVCHCPNAFGVAITHKEGWKITYSGDTMPCNELVKLGMESDLLIHEATMEDELVDEARAKRHSTTSEAVKIGHEMQARFTILTHFSQRYAKLPRIQGSMKANVGIAFDNMQVTLQDLKVLPIMYPALKLMFSEHCEEMEHKATRRQLKLERERKNVP